MDAQTKRLFQEFKKFHDGLAAEASVDYAEAPAEKRKRIARLEADPEAWFKYHFGAYATAAPAAFHKAATRRVLGNPEWFEVRSWSRELAKSTRTMMEVLYLALVRKNKRNILLVSNSKDNADRLLQPYMSNLERNQRLLNDYGDQQSLGAWTIGEFTTKGGVSFRALGAGQSPRGTRNDAIRPDTILVDDIDTDDDCRNPDIIDKRWEWIEQALIPTRSISNPLLMIFCGNIIAEDCCIVRAQKNADKVDIVNIRDAEGKSSWPEKNSEEHIDRVLSSISYASQQKEYFNNPMSTGKTFTELTWAKCPPLKSLPFVVVYADPATSNKDKPGQKSNLSNSRKAVFIVGFKDNKYYIYTGFLDVMSNHSFIASFYACRDYIGKQTTAYYYVENNTLQDPFYEQVLLPLIFDYGKNNGGVLPISPDVRKKPEKWFRIEASLEPLNRTSRLIFNEDEKTNPHMERLAAQFLAARPTSRQLDGPDCIEGAVHIATNKMLTNSSPITGFKRKPHSKRY